jgi:hypothetical protein
MLTEAQLAAIKARVQEPTAAADVLLLLDEIAELKHTLTKLISSVHRATEAAQRRV